MCWTLVSSGKARETFLDETRAHRGNERAGIPVKVHTIVREPTGGYQHRRSPPPHSGSGKHLRRIRELRLGLLVEEVPDIWHYTSYLSQFCCGGMGLVKYRARIVLENSGDSVHGEIDEEHN